MKPVGILRFLGTNCDADVVTACEDVGVPQKYLWWADHFEINDYAAFVLPGGFSYGDYLRCGAMAARTPAMEDVRQAAKKGFPVLGICNGFQILCEAGLLPGALTKNVSRSFQDQWVELEPVSKKVFWNGSATEKFSLPIAHSMGRYLAKEDELKKLFDQEQVWLKYTANPNGSLHDIAGISNKEKNVAALMPHPERAMQSWMGGAGGRPIFEVLKNVGE